VKFYTTQDLRGIRYKSANRAFFPKAKWERSHPESKIDVLYLSGHSTDDNLEILPVDSLKRKIISSRIPFI
jgi:hypothetical protein